MQASLYSMSNYSTWWHTPVIRVGCSIWGHYQDALIVAGQDLYREHSWGSSRSNIQCPCVKSNMWWWGTLRLMAKKGNLWRYGHKLAMWVLISLIFIHVSASLRSRLDPSSWNILYLINHLPASTELMTLTHRGMKSFKVGSGSTCRAQIVTPNVYTSKHSLGISGQSTNHASYV